MKSPERTYRYTEAELDHLEYLKTDPEEKIAQVGEPLSASSSEDNDLWLNEIWLPEQLPSEHRKQATEDSQGAFESYDKSYLCMINAMRAAYKPGEQVFNSYGVRSNQYLLCYYGFCFEDNLYDSYAFNVRMDVNTKDLPVIRTEHLLAGERQDEHLQVIRLKNHQLNFVLLAYLRKVKCEKYFGRNSTMVKKILLTKVRHLDFEIDVMKSYLELVSKMLAYEEHGHPVHVTGKRVPGRTTLKQDLEILERDCLQPVEEKPKDDSEKTQDEKTAELLSWLEGKPEPKKASASLSPNMRMAIRYRAERKKILSFQVELADFLVDLLSFAVKL